MIVDLGVAAWPVALLSALHYFLAPLTLWAGHRSDTRPILGSRRVAYIWLGRLLMLLSLPLLPLSTVAIAQDAASPLGWALAVVSFLFYGVGTLISGAPFLALVHDSAPYEHRGQAISIVQTVLVVSFAFMQDAVLEPFGGDVFGLAAGETTRFNAYWGTGVVIGMIGTIFFTRQWRPDQQISTTAWGLALLSSQLLLLGAASLLEALSLVTPVLIAFGLGFGIFTVGGVSLLMAMSTEQQAGSYLALWSVVQLVARGAGIASGGLILQKVAHVLSLLHFLTKF